MSAPVQLEVKFLDVWGDYYHMPNGSILMTADRKLGIPLYVDFLKNYGFNDPKLKKTTGTGLVAGVATEEEAEFIKSFGVPYIYGPSLVSQKETCRPKNYAKIKEFLAYRLVTIESQINNPLSVSSGSSLSVEKFKKVKKKLADFMKEMDSTKQLPVCDDYKIDYFQDDSDLMNYLTRALYYGLKPQAGTDEHVKCVNLFRDAKGADAELNALLTIVKDKRKDGMLSFMELVGSTLAGLIQKINQDRSFASATIGAAAATGAAATSSAHVDTIRKLHDLLINFFDEISKSDSGEIGKKTFIKGQPIPEILTQFTSAVGASKKYLTSSGKTATSWSPSTVEELKQKIMQLADKNPFAPLPSVVGKVYDKNMSKVLTELINFLENGPVTSAAVGNMIDKITLINAFKHIDVMEILKSYMGEFGLINQAVSSSNLSGLITSFQKLFAVLYSLNLFDDLKSKQAKIMDNIKILFNNTVEYNGKEYRIMNFSLYKSGEILYGFYRLNDGTNDVVAYFDEDIKSTSNTAAGVSIAKDDGNPYLSVEEYYNNVDKTYKIGNKINDSIIREQYLYSTMRNDVYFAASAAAADPSVATSTPRMDNATNSFVVRDKDVYNFIVIGMRDRITINTGNADDGKEKPFDLGAASAGGTGSGGSSADVARLTAELAAAKADLLRLQGELTTKEGTITAQTAELIKARTDLAAAITNYQAKNQELEDLKAARAGAGAADPAKDAQIAALTAEVGQLRANLIASAAAAANKITTSDATLATLEADRVGLVSKLQGLQNAISGATIFKGRDKVEQRDAINNDLVTKLNEIIAALQKRIQALEQLNITLVGKKDTELRDAQAAAKTALDEAQAKLKTAQDQLAEANRLKDAADQQKTAETARCADLERQIQELTATGTAKDGQLEELRQQLADAQQARDEARAAQAAAAAGGTGVEELGEQIRQKKAECDSLRAQIDELTAASGGKDTRIAELEAALGTARAELNAARAAAAAGGATGTGSGAAAGPDQTAQIARLETQIQDLERQLQEAQTGRGAANTEKADALRRAEAAEAATAAAQAEVTRLTAELSNKAPESTAEVQELRQNLETATSNLAAARAQLEDARGELETLQTGTAEKDSRIETLGRQIEAINQELTTNKSTSAGEITRLTALVTSLTAEKDAAVAEAAKTTTVTEARLKLASSLEASNKKAAELEGQLASVRSELDTAKATATREKEEKTLATQRAIQLQNELEALRKSSATQLASEKQRLEAELQAARATALKKPTISQDQIERLEALHTSLQERIDSAKASIASLEGRIRTLAAEKVKLEQEVGQIRGIAFTKQTLQRLATELKSTEDRARLSEAEIKRRDAIAGVQKASTNLGQMISNSYKDDAEKQKSILATVQQQLQRAGENIAWQESQLQQFAKDKNQLMGALAQLQKEKKELEFSLSLKTFLAKKRGRDAAAEPAEDPSLREMLDTIRDYIMTKGLTPEKFSEMEGALADVATLETQLNISEEEIQRLTNELEAALSRASSAEGSLDTAKVSLEMADLTSEAKIKELEEKLSKNTSMYLSQISTLQERLANIYKKYLPIDIVEKEYNILKEYIDKLEKELSKKKDLVGSIRTIFVEEPSSGKPQSSQRKLDRLRDANKKLKKGLISNKGTISKEEHEIVLAGKDTKIADLTAQLAAVEESRQNALAAAETAQAELQAENQALQVENTELQSQVTKLEAEIAKMRSESKAQTFGSLSGMLSSPAFKAATIGVFTNFASKKREAYNNANVNANVRSSLPSVPEPSQPLREYYIQTLEALAKELGVVNKDGSAIDGIPTLTIINNSNSEENKSKQKTQQIAEIQVLANILKMMSNPQPSGLYALLDQKIDESTIKTLIDKLNTQDIGFSSYEPSLFIPIKSMDNIKIDTAKAVSNQTDNITLGKYFNNKSNNIFITYPLMEISGEQSEGVADLNRETYIGKVSLSLFNIRKFVVQQEKFINDKMLSDLKEKEDKEDKQSFFTKPANGKLISRAEIIRIFIKSLLSALKTAWGL